MAGPAIGAASAGAGDPTSISRGPDSSFALDPFAEDSFGGLPGLARGRASAGAGTPKTAIPGVTSTGFGDGPFGDAPFGEGAGASAQPAVATATAGVGDPTSIARYGVAAAHALAGRGRPLDVTVLLNEAVAEADRVPTFGLRADWGDANYSHPLSELTPVVTEFSVERELTDLDDAIGLVQGTAATKFTATLAGRWQPQYDGPVDTDPVKAFAPYRTDADLAGLPIIGRELSLTTGMQTRVGPVTQQRFTGTVSGFSPSSANRQVVLEGLDPVDRLRVPVYQPAWGQDRQKIAQPENIGLRARRKMNSQWWIDRALRQGGFYASPPPGNDDHATVLFSATFHGSPLAEYGYNLRHQGNEPDGDAALDRADYLLDGHPYGMMSPNPEKWLTDYFIARNSLDASPGHGYAVSCLMQVGPSPVASIVPLVSIQPAYRRMLRPEIRLELNDGVPRLAIYGGDGVTDRTFPFPGWVVPTEQSWVFIGAHVRFTDTQALLTLYRGDTQQTYTSAVGLTNAQFVGDAEGLFDPHAHVFTMQAFAMTNLTIWSTPMAPTEWVGDGWIATATIDPGANWFTGAPDIRGREAYDLIKDITSAELAGFFFDENGMPRWRSRAVVHDPASIETVTAQRALTDMVTRVDEQTVRNVVTSDCQRMETQAPEPIWELKDPTGLDMVAGGIQIIEIDLPTDVAYIPGFDFFEYNGYHFTSQQWRDSVHERFAYATEIKYAAIDPADPTVDLPFATDNILMDFYRIDQIDPFKLLLIIRNNTGQNVRFATNTADDDQSDPAFIISGGIVDASFSVPIGRHLYDSQTRYGVRAYALPQGPWRQDIAADAEIADSILEWTGYPRPVLDKVDVPHSPRRKLYDQVTVADPEGLGSVTGKLAGIHTTYSGSDGARDELLVRPNEPPPGW